MQLLRQLWNKIPRPARRVLVLVIGLLFIVVGSLMLVVPGPGWATIFLGLAILATEFDQAARVKAFLIRHFKRVIQKVRGGNKD